MKRELLRFFFALALVGVTCVIALGAHRLQMRSVDHILKSKPAQSPVVLVSSPTTIPSPTATQVLAPVDSPVPRVDALWYAERNAQLVKLIQRNRPNLQPADIDSRIRQMYIDPDKPMVALTFDDGPKPGITDQILDILEQYHVRATFFVCGWRFKNKDNWAIAKRAVSLGCEIGNHTWAHEDVQKLNYVAVRRTIQDTNDQIFKVTGYQPHSMRPPGGHNSWEAMRVARDNDMAIVFWSQSGNVNEVDPQKIAQNVQQQIVDGRELQDGDIILLHDTKPLMVDAVKLIVPQLLDEGYQLVTVWELLNSSEEGFVAGGLYDHQ